jgi:hypothetical protein
VIRFLPFGIEIILLVWCLVECIQTPAHLCRNIEKTWWIVLIIFVPLVGSVAWLVAGRPVRQSGSTQWRTGGGFPESERPKATVRRNEDDPAFMAEMARIDAEHEASLKRWEAKLAAQEAELRRREQGGDPGASSPPSP